MNNKTNGGYKDEALNALKKAGCTVGDVIRITNNDKSYEGILIPRSETGDTAHIVVKLKSGYNIGVHVTSDTTIEKIGKGAKPAFVAPDPPKQNPNLPKVVIMSTGGTIASRVDYRTGAVRSALSASDLYGVVPELSDIARVDTQILYSLYSENITTTHWKDIADIVAARQIQSDRQR